MHVGMSMVFQSPQRQITDQQVYLNELALADQAEPLGFQSVWGVEHHFTDYTMCPDVMQFLSYMAGRTQHVQLGSMVMVLPWHDTIRAAEQISMLDNLSGGRTILGIGRGLARFEFEGFGLEMSESRGRFLESAQTLLNGLEQGYCEFEGRFVKQAKRDIRPAPIKSFRGRTYAAAVSPESSRVMAELGVGLLIIPQKPWEDTEKELETYRHIFLEVNGVEAPPPVETWVMRSMRPISSTASAVDPPPTMVVAFRDARASPIRRVPFENGSNSNTPMGPFQMTVLHSLRPPM